MSPQVPLSTRMVPTVPERVRSRISDFACADNFRLAARNLGSGNWEYMADSASIAASYSAFVMKLTGSL